MVSVSRRRVGSAAHRSAATGTLPVIHVTRSRVKAAYMADRPTGPAPLPSWPAGLYLPSPQVAMVSPVVGLIFIVAREGTDQVE